MGAGDDFFFTGGASLTGAEGRLGTSDLLLEGVALVSLPLGRGRMLKMRNPS